MQPTARADVAPQLLRWARETAGLSAEEAARQLGVKPDRLGEWEAGQLSPTVPQLRKAAAVYKRPLATFFLAEPPATAAPLHDFRRLPLEGSGEAALSPALLLAIRRAHRRRRIAVELARATGASPQPFSVRGEPSDDEGLGARLRSLLGVTLDDQVKWRGDYQPLNAWVAALEARDVLVFQASHISVEEMRGFSISERTFPVIVLNSKDSPRARVFTLMHELVHLALSEGGVCDPLEARRGAHSRDDEIEVFCNRIAGAVLVPADALLAQPLVRAATQPREWDDSELHRLAQLFGVSDEVILRRLLILRKTTEAFYEARRRAYQEGYAAMRIAEAARPVRIPPSVIVVRNNGRLYTRLVLEALDSDRITFADVADYLGTNLKHLDAITDLVGAGRPAEAVV